MAYENSKFKNDLNLLSLRFPKSSQPVRDKVQILIDACLNLTLTSEADSADISKTSSPSISIPEEAGPFCVKNGDDGSGDENLNPLEIPVVLNNILCHLPINSLLNCRLVNQTWNSEAAPLVQHRFSRYFRPDTSDFPGLCPDFDDAKVVLLTSLSIQLDGLTLGDCSTFFTKHGTQIRTFCIREYYDSKWNPETLNIMRHIFKNIPNIRALSLRLFHRSEFVAEEFIFDEEELQEVVLHRVVTCEVYCSSSWMTQSFLSGLFTMVPNSNLIRFGKFEENDQTSGVFVEAMKKLKVESLFISPFTEHSAELYRSMAVGDFRLKLLEMRIDQPFIDAQEEFLQSQSEVLEVLLLNTNRKENPIASSLIFPVMKKLKSLKLHTPWDPPHPYAAFVYPIEPITPEQVPNLDLLCIDPLLMKFDAFAASAFPSVIEVDLIRVIGESNHVQILHELKARFPNLKKLNNFQTHLNAATMSMIVNNLGNIEDLDLRVIRNSEPVKNFNMVISGVPVGSGWALTKAADLLGYAALPSLFDTSEASLRDLKGLKKLVITFSVEPYYVVIDEIAVYYTFLRLSPKIHLTLLGNFSISSTLAAKLTAHYQSIYVLPNEPPPLLDASGLPESNAGSARARGLAKPVS